MLLLVLYFVVMTLAKNSFSSALSQLNTLKFWVIPLIITFGFQVGLFNYAKESRKNVSGVSTTVNTTASGIAMVACCAHHVTDIFPLIGFSVLAAFLAQYQIWFLAVGILSNFIGIGIMLKQLKLKR